MATHAAFDKLRLTLVDDTAQQLNICVTLSLSKGDVSVKEKAGPLQGGSWEKSGPA